MTTLYREIYRPHCHLTPPEGPMSDPNGMVYYKGEYHQFYQFTGRWGHAVSRDLVHWEHLPLALVGDELGDIWSGSAVVDWKDTSGLFDGGSGLVAIFTHYKEGLQSQSLAYSRDEGRTWEKYAGNPVIPNPGLSDFRDPKVLWHEETGRWVMIVSIDKAVAFYSSPNLLEWRLESRFGGEGVGCQAAVWECPDLFRLPVANEPGVFRWVLHVSIGDNEETDGSTAQYFVGDFDGRVFTPEHEDICWTDHGQDFYAAVTYSDIPESDGRTIWLAWTSNWQYPFEAPTAPWKGGMSLPRELVLTRSGEGELMLLQRPVSELKRLRGEGQEFGPLLLADQRIPLDFRGRSYEFEAIVSWEKMEEPAGGAVEAEPVRSGQARQTGKAAEFGICVRSSGREETVLGFRPGRKELFLDRSRSGFTELPKRTGGIAHFAKEFRAPYVGDPGRIRLRGFVDESVIEWFVGDGETVFTSLVYPDPKSDGLELYARGGTVRLESFTVYPLASIWT